MVAQKKNSRQAKKSTKKQRRVEPVLPGGFRDYGPVEAIARAEMIETIRKTFESFGFDPLETSSVQRTDVLLSGETESDKIVYRLNPASRGIKQEIERDEASLRFDLTVPLARFMAANPEIPKPFKRYQIGTVWRGESPQAGRYREFMQADADIIGSASLDADAEIIAVIYQTLKNLGIDNFKIKINSRKLLNALPKLCGFSSKDLWAVLRVLDKTDKIGFNNVFKKLESIVGAESAQEIKKVISRSSKDITQISLNGEIITEEASRDLWTLGQYLATYGLTRGEYWDFDISIVRGLGYYTGIIFEVILTDAPEMGSIFSGGRYDNLVSQFTGQNISAVGASIGVDRLFAALEKRGRRGNKKTQTSVLIFQLDAALKSDYLGMAQELRQAGINTALYLGDDQTFQAQLAYAVKKEIPFVILYGEEEKKKGVVAVKNLATRQQREVLREELAQNIKEGLDSRDRVGNDSRRS